MIQEYIAKKAERSRRGSAEATQEHRRLAQNLRGDPYFAGEVEFWSQKPGCETRRAELEVSKAKRSARRIDAGPRSSDAKQHSNCTETASRLLGASHLVVGSALDH